MSESAGEGASVGPPGDGPGALSRLLEELARAPHADADGAWGKALRPGDVLDRFEILRELGRGGFGAVYEALDRELGRKVALKTLRPGRSRDEWSDEALRREAQAAASLSHPGIVTLHEACTCDRGPYLVMELLRGETLESRLSRGPLPEAEAVEVGLQMARALAHVHGHGLVHRDLKPGNVFLGEDGRVKLLDLGLAHLLGRKSSTGGTPAYVAPEQWRGEDVDGRADVFALGAVLFEMVSGRRAFEVREERSSALDAGPAPALGGKVPRGLARLVARCLAKEPSGRPTAAQAAEELLGIQRGHSRPRAVRRVGLILGAGVLVGLAIAAATLRRGADGGTLPEGQVVVAVADFANETKDPDLDALSGLLITSLEQSHRLRVLTRGRMLEILDRLGHREAPRIDERLARLVGREAGVNALLLATIRRFDHVYSVEMRALDPTRDDYLFAVKAEGRGKESLPGVLDEVSEKARRRFQEGRRELAASSVKVAESVTADLEAYRHFFAGVECLDRESFFRTVHCISDFERAVERDPGFALAHAHLASLRSQWRLPGDEGSAEAALRNIERAPARDRAKIRFLAGAADWRASHIAEGREALRVAPDDRYLAFKLAQLMAWHGDQSGAIPIYRQLVDAHPSGESPARYHLAVALAFTGADDALRRLADGLAVGPQTHLTVEALAFARGRLGDLPGWFTATRRVAELAPPDQRQRAEDRLRMARVKIGDPSVEREVRALAEGNPDHLLTLAYLQTLQGRSREATSTLEAAAASPPTTGRTTVLRWDRTEFVAADLLTGRGDAAALWQHATRLKPDPGRPPTRDTEEPLFTFQGRILAASLAYAGDLDRAALLARGLEPGFIHERTYRAVAAWRAGDRAEARRLLEPLAASNPVGLRTASLSPSFLLGELAAEMGDDRKAVEALRTFRSFWHAWTCPHQAWAYPRSLYLAARSHERLGEVGEARKLVDELLTLWKRADPDLPLLAEARALRKRLAAQAAAEKTPQAPAPTTTKAKATTPSIAVLPFADMSPGKDQEYFANGVAEEILNALTRVSGLKVIGRTSSFSFKGTRDDLRSIGRKLGVAHVLEGSVRREGSRIRIAAQLLKAADGHSLWSQIYDRELTGVFEVQDEVARAVVASLEVKLVAGTTTGGLRPAPTTRPEVYEQYLLGRQYHQRLSYKTFGLAVRAYERALELDPGFAPAWAALGIPLLYDARRAPTRAVERAQQLRALAAAERALELAPDLPEGLRARGYLRQTVAWDWEGARADLERAVQLYPGDQASWHAYGVLLDNLGRSTEAIAAVERAVALDPLSASWLKLGQVQEGAGRLDLARASLERARLILPESPIPRWGLAGLDLLEGRAQEALAVFEELAADGVASQKDVARALHSLGRKADAEAALVKLKTREPRVRPLDVASACAWMERPDCAFEWLDRAWQEHDGELGEAFRTRPDWRPLHRDPRWKAFLRKLNLPVD